MAAGGWRDRNTTGRAGAAWSEHEKAVLVREYPAGGLDACVAILTDRTRAAIQVMATKTGVAPKKPRVNPKPVAAPALDPLRYEKARGKPRSALTPPRYLPLFEPMPPPRPMQPTRPGAEDFRRIPSLTSRAHDGGQQAEAAAP